MDAAEGNRNEVVHRGVSLLDLLTADMTPAAVADIDQLSIDRGDELRAETGTATVAEFAPFLGV